jgi:large subunit ribosomal protein L13
MLWSGQVKKKGIQGTDMNPTKCYTTKAADRKETWYVIDAEDQILGRVACAAAAIMRGKYNVRFAPYLDLGEHVIIINAAKVRVTGKKLDQKMYRRHSGYMGGLKEVPLRRKLAEKPEWVVMQAVKGMLPKNRLGRALLKKLRVYDGPEHRHVAQKPIPFELGK